MKRFILTFSPLSLWISAAIIAVLPCLLALEYGGVLPWAHWAGAVMVFIAAIFALPSVFDDEVRSGMRFHWLTLLLLGWAFFSWFQTIPLPASLVSLLSPGSADAYRNWGGPVLPPSEAARSFFPVSIDPWTSRHSVAVLMVVATLAWVSATVFQDRRRLAMILIGIAIGSALNAFLGIFHLVAPQISLPEMDEIRRGSHFAAFVNRNNAALFMNLGMGASLGLLAWRLSALIGTEVDDESFELNDLVSLVSDRDSFFGLISLAICAAALLVCGSRGGIVGALVGLTLGFGWIRARRSTFSIPVVLTVIAISVALLLVPLDLDLKSIDRFQFFSTNDQTSLLNDGRVPLWHDSLSAAKSHLPMGSGLGSYAYAHLPFIDRSGGSWAHHADNLWMDLLVEQGLAGLVLALLLVIGLIHSLLKLNDSPDAVDHGLRVAGWYVLGSLIVSQFFDMGLIATSNLFASTTILAVAASRGFLVAPRVEHGLQRHQRNTMATASRLIEEYEEEDSDSQIVELESEVQTPFRLGSKLDLSVKRVLTFWRRIKFPAFLHMTEERPSSLENPATLKPESRIRFRNDSIRTPALILAAVAILPLLWALSVLTQDAHIDAARRFLSEATRDPRFNPSEIEKATVRLIELAERSGSPDAHQVLGELFVQFARYDEVVKSNPKSANELKEIYFRTDPELRRRRKPEENSSSDKQTSEHYSTALTHIESVLRSCPLSREARVYSLYLDAVNADRTRTREILKQLKTLYGNTPGNLDRFAALCLANQEHGLAKDCLRQALTRNPNYTAQALKLIASHPEISAGEIIPETTENYRVAARLLIAQPTWDRDLVSKLYEGLRCGESKTLAEKASCLELFGDTAYALEEYEESFQSYEESLRLVSSNAHLRIKYINRLREQSKLKEALAEARKGRLISPEDKRFDSIIEQMASEQLQQ